MALPRSLHPSDQRALLAIQVEALFRLDDRGRMISTNEPEPGAAPRVFLGRSMGGNLWRFHADLSADLVARLEAILLHEPVPAHLAAPPSMVADVLAELGEGAVVDSHGPAWRCPENLPASDVAQLVEQRDVHLVSPHYPYLADHLAGLSPCAVVVDGGVAVAACSSVRITDRACEAGVGTEEAFRGKGYASDAVSTWADAVRATGRIPLYSTSWDNAASRRVAEKLGLIQYGIDLSIH